MTTALAGASTFGVLRVGAARVAVALGVLREVLPCPELLEPLPAADNGLLGALNVRGAVIPVLDLRQLLGWPAERTAEQVVTVVSLDDRVIGLLCDEVLGVTRLVDARLQRLADTGGSLLFSHSFERPEDGRIVSLLDIERLLSLPGLPAVRSVSEPVADTVAGTEPGPRDVAGVEMVVVSCGAVRFGLDVASVHALLPNVQLNPSPLVGRLCTGVTGYAERSIAAVHLLRLVGLAGAEDPDVNGGLILTYPSADGPGYVALLFSEVIEIVRVLDSQRLPLPAVMSSVAGWFHGLVALPGIGDVLVLDPVRLAGDPDLGALAAMNTGEGEDAPEPDAAGSTPAGIRYLTYSAGHDVATPLLQVSEIITYPEAWTPIRRPESGLLGVFTHRGVVVPLVCLSSLLGGEPVTEDPADPDRRVVMVGVPDGTGAAVGFVVAALRAIEVSVWEESGADDVPPGGFSSPAAAAEASHVIRVGGHGSDRNLRTLDLAAVAAALSAAPDS